MGKCMIQVDRVKFKPGEVIYMVFSNTGDSPLRMGTWQVIDEATGSIVFTMEPPQMVLQPSTSIMVTWFQVNNNGEQVNRGKYRITWRPRDESGNELDCHVILEIT